MLNYGKCCWFAFMVPALAFADTAAVKETNYSLGLDYRNLYGDSYEIQGRIAAPLGKNVGFEIYAGGGNSNLDGNHIDSSGSYIGGAMFTGSPEVGRAGISFLKSKTEYDSNTDDFEIDSRLYAIDLNWYLDNFSIGVLRGFHKSNVNKPSVIIDEDGDSLLVGASYYYRENYKIELSTGGMDMEDINSVSFEFMPSFLRKKTSIGVSYTDMPKDHSVSLAITYYFTDSVSFIERNRAY